MGGDLKTDTPSLAPRVSRRRMQPPMTFVNPTCSTATFFREHASLTKHSLLPSLRMPPLRRRILSLACLSALCAPAFAQTPAAAATDYIPGGRIPQLQGEIAIDGLLDDAAWQGALVQEIAYDIQPGDNTPAQALSAARQPCHADRPVDTPKPR